MPTPTIPPDLKQLYDRNQRLLADHILDGCPHVIVELIERIGRDEALVSDACKKAAVEICNTYEVAAPRGVSFANRPPVTISIIIEQALIAARSKP